MRKWTVILALVLGASLGLRGAALAADQWGKQASKLEETGKPARHTREERTSGAEHLALPGSIRDVYAGVRDKIVEVDFELEYELAGRTHSVKGGASGIVVREDGLVMFTGFALLRGAYQRLTPAGLQDIKVTFLDETEYQAEYVGTDRKLNLAFVRVKTAADTKLPFLEFKPAVSLEVGDPVIVCDVLPDKLGGGLKAEVARIAAVVQKPGKLYVIHPQAVQAVGAPVFNASGEAVGVIGISAAFGSQARSYVIGRTCATFLPASLLTPLIENPPPKESTRSWLGVSVRQALTPELATYWGVEGHQGVIVAHAYQGYPAAQAGIKDEDIIIEFDGEPVEVSRNNQIDNFIDRVGRIPPGRKIAVKVLRRQAGKFAQQVLEVTVEEAPKDRYHAEKFKDDDFGITVREVTFDSADDPEDPDSFVGVIVDKVEAGGWAGLGGVRARDRILKIGEDQVKGLDDFKRLLELARKAKQKEVLFFVRRGISTHYIRAETHWE